MSTASAPRNGDHETYDELAVGWALHALEPEDEVLFARHLPDCARCARTVAETSEVMGALATDLPPAEPSEELRHRVRRAVERAEQIRGSAQPADRPADPPADRPPPPARTGSRAPQERPDAGAPARTPWRPPGARPQGRSRRLSYALVAAAAAVIVGLGAWNVALSTSREQAQATASQQAHIVDSLLAPGQATIAPVSDSDGHSVATVVARHGQMQVVTWGLAQNDRGATTYVVWGMREGAPVALGTFDVVQAGMDLRTVGSDHTGLDGFSGYAISMEPGRRAPSTPTDIVANGQVTS